jgi:proteasome lid subunit RPN8/RPN11
MSMALKIHRTPLEQIRRHGAETYPYECCGALVGNFDETGKTVKAVVRCGNAHGNSPRNRYRISPDELVRIQCEAQLAGRDIVGFYHSHPDSSAMWSGTDLAEAHWTGCSYIITSVEDGEPILTNSFVLLCDKETKRFEKEVIES